MTLGKCPKCGADIVTGQYGAYCTGKCGFFCNKAYGQELTEEQIVDLLNGEEIFLEDLISKSGNYYDIYLKPTGIRDFSYTSKDRKKKTGYSFEFESRFPDRGENE